VSAEDDGSRILSNNIAGTTNLFEAARIQGIRRVLFASNHHAVGHYLRRRRIGPDDPARPEIRYAVSKVFGESPRGTMPSRSWRKSKRVRQ